ncbi:MAG: hypothetical protein ACON3Z_18135 [Bradymonadia bacterium]
MITLLRRYALVIALCAAGPVYASPQDQANLMPDITQMVFQLDMKGLQNTKIFKELVATNPAYERAMEQFTGQSGIDAKSIKMITVAFFDVEAKNPMAILLDVPFPAAPKGTTGKKTLGKQTYYSLPGGAVAAPYHGKVLMTEEPLLKHFVGKKMGLKGAIAGLSKNRDMKAQLWVFGTPPKKMAAKAVKGPKGAPDVGSVQATINLASGLNLNLAVETDPKFAQELVSKFGEEKAKLAQNPMMMMMGLGPVITKSQLTAKGKDLTLALNLSDMEFNQIINMVKMMTQKKAGAGMPGAPGKPGISIQPPAPAVPATK